MTLKKPPKYFAVRNPFKIDDENRFNVKLTMETTTAEWIPRTQKIRKYEKISYRERHAQTFSLTHWHKKIGNRKGGCDVADRGG